ncbi:40-residue YVTN family beta-propeller repeat-containing protein [Chryseolinea serpens]|uniref:40-residue YVTN family beta-propeller repeat-containing protein n=1 Tax=Chryseolinea serpens TaxID=947013 RepID=A0A1M5KC58_9BACT|nr:bifunctional YncE family protein/alkaline phosphatase family protein [Chryseolinea serpens]SHG50365.1 40-residue YVTN family beta-propeller repeat-containing protein [Chryseolinea serpens]
MTRSFLFITLYITAQTLLAQPLPKPVLLPNGWKLTPAGTSFPLGDLPLNMVVSPSSKYLAVTNNGQGIQSIELIDLQKQKKIDSVVVSRSWYGLAFSADEKYLFASGGHDNLILQFALQKDKLILTDTLKLGKPWPEKIGPAGIEVDDKRQRLYVVTREDQKLYVIDLKTKKILNILGLGAEAYACKLSRDKKELYISCWGCDKLLTLDLEKNIWKNPITVGDNPNELLLTPDGKYLYVCNANDNSVSVIDNKSKKVIETLDAALFPDSPSGSTTNSLAYDPSEKKLYIANADNNCLAVFDVSKPGRSSAMGFIPTGWYPTCVRLVNKKLWVSNGKGFESKANPFGPSPVRKKEDVIHHGGITKEGSDVQYIGSLLKGTMSIIDIPSAKILQEYTGKVYSNSPYSQYRRDTVNLPAPIKTGKESPVKYVFYVIKENRTYDQVLADVKGGNGDTTLLLFGRKYTPNQHALVESFVLLDNFYVNAEVSADGHSWSMGAYATDYLEKTWPSSYSGRGGTYGGEGEREIANNKNGFIWNNCSRYGISYRTYGEFMEHERPTIPILAGHNCPTYPSYSLEIRDTSRFYVWKKDFLSLLNNNKLPQFNTVRFGNDHTEGVRLGRPSPYAHVADNDLAVGMFIETLAQSPIWNETVVFIVEDDAQNGADHVDAHRSTAYIAGGYIKRNVVDHTLYTTASMLRTMELLLGMEPMTQYDAAATPMWSCFNSNPAPSSFHAIMPKVSLDEKNVAINQWQKKSEQFSFAKEDSNNDIEFNQVLWHGLKGETPFPGPKRAAFVIPLADGDDD